MVEDEINSITDVSETLLIPLYARAIETRSENPVINDVKAVEITEKLNKVFSKSSTQLHRQLAEGRIRRHSSKKLAAFLSIRSRRFDRYCQDFIKRKPDGVIIELGCGLSSRFSRIDNGTLEWFDLDLPEVIDVRKSFFQESKRYHMIASSVLDFSWMDMVSAKDVLFVAEGLFMYLHEEDVKNLILKLQRRFPRCELVCEVENTFVIELLKKERWKRKFQRDHHLGSDATMHFGIRDGRDLEQWGDGIKFVDEWTIFDDHEKKLGWMNLFSFSKKLRKSQWIVRYKLM